MRAMKNSFKGLLIVIVIALSGPVDTNAQDAKGQQIARLNGGGFVAFKTTTEPASAQEFSFSGAENDSNVVHRVLIDKSGKFYFGYDLEVDPLVDARKFRVRVLPLSKDFAQQLRSRKDFKATPLSSDSKMAPISKSSTVELLDDGDTVALDVLFNPETKIKIIDLISVSFDYLKLREAPVSNAPARDYTLDDVELRVSNYQLLINGEVIAGAKPTGGYGGPIIWFYVPGKGRFVMSLSPHAGYDFKKIGSIQHNKISFTAGGDYYEWVSSSPIVGSGGNWNLWVLYDPTYVSEFAQPDSSAEENRSASSSSGVTQSGNKSTQSKDALTAEGFGQDADLNSSKKPKRTDGIVASGAAALKRSLRWIRPIFGVADRIENLLPGN
jgi:hypothetical protein